MGFSLFSKSRAIDDTEVLMISDLVVLSSVQLANRIKSAILDELEATNSKSFQLVVIESLCMYMHSLNKFAIQTFSKKQMPIFLDKLASLTAIQVLKVICEGQSDSNKRIFAELFRDNYNKTQSMYGVARSLINKEEPFLGNGLFSIFARRIAETITNNLNPEIIMRTIEILAIEYKGEKLKEMINSIK